MEFKNDIFKGIIIFRGWKVDMFLFLGVVVGVVGVWGWSWGRKMAWRDFRILIFCFIGEYLF